MIELRFAHLCDYAGTGDRGKAIVVGIYDVLYDPGTRPIPLPLSYFVARLEASIADGTEHELSVVVRHEDGAEVHRVDVGKVSFAPSGPGRPLSAQFFMFVGGMPFPEQGDYDFEIFVNNQKVGKAALYIVPTPPA